MHRDFVSQTEAEWKEAHGTMLLRFMASVTFHILDDGKHKAVLTFQKTRPVLLLSIQIQTSGESGPENKLRYRYT